jgi:hypothetical protein
MTLTPRDVVIGTAAAAVAALPTLASGKLANSVILTGRGISDGKAHMAPVNLAK